MAEIQPQLLEFRNGVSRLWKSGEKDECWGCGYIEGPHILWLQGLEDQKKQAMNQSEDKTLFLQLGSEVRRIPGRMPVLDCGIWAIRVKADLILTPMYCYILSSLVWRKFVHISAVQLQPSSHTDNCLRVGILGDIIMGGGHAPCHSNHDINI